MVIYLQYLFVRTIKSFGWGKICIYDNLDTTLRMRLAGARCLSDGGRVSANEKRAWAGDDQSEARTLGRGARTE